MSFWTSVLQLFCGRPDDLTQHSATVARKQLLEMSKDLKPPKVTAPVEKK